MKAQGLNITGTGPTHAAVLELVLGNRRVRLTVDAEAIDAGAAAADDAMFIARILPATPGRIQMLSPRVREKPPITSIIKALETGSAACDELDRQAGNCDPVGFFRATTSRSFKLHTLHDVGPFKAGQPVLVVHSDRGMVDCIPWPESMLRIPANELTELIVNEVDGPLLGETSSPTCGECQGAGVTAEETTSPEGAPAIVEDTCGRCGGEGVEPAPLGFKVPTVDEAALASARWLGDTLVTPEVAPADLEGRRARVEPIPTDLKVRVALDRLFTALERARVLDGQEHDGCSDDELIDRVTALVPALAALRRPQPPPGYSIQRGDNPFDFAARRLAEERRQHAGRDQRPDLRRLSMCDRLYDRAGAGFVEREGLLEVTLDVDRDAVHFLTTVERWPAGDKKHRIAGFDLVLVPAGVEARVGGLAYFGRARIAGPCEGRVFPPEGWHHLNETHVFYLPICLDQPTDVGEDAPHGEARP